MSKPGGYQYLSKRGEENVDKDNWGALEKVLGNAWHQSSNPNGCINMGVAENSLMHPEITNYFEKTFTIASASHLTYGVGPRGSLRLRKAVAAFFNSHFHARKAVTHEQILIACGASSVIDLLTWATCNEGDGVMIPQPYYQGFPMEICDRSRGQIVPVPYHGVDGFNSIDDVFSPQANEAAIERAYDKAVKEGIRPRGFILVNPHNPLGKCYSIEAIRAIAKVCGRLKIHLWADEIYAMSVFSNPSAPDAEGFHSVLSMDLDDIIDPGLVHVIYSSSKDFSANGTRLGVFQSRNEELVRAIATVSMFSWPPYMVQDAWANMLEDRRYLDGFIRENQRRLQRSFETLTRFLERLGIPYLKKTNASVFLWADFRQFLLDDPQAHDLSSSKLVEDLTESSPNADKYRAREEEILNACLNEGVFIGSGTKFFTEELGWFRITFTLEQEMLEEGLRRIEKGLQDYKRKHSAFYPRARL